MSLRQLILSLIAGVLGLTVVSLGIAFLFFDTQIERLFSDRGTEILSLRFLFIIYSCVVLAFMVFIAGVSYFALSRYVVRPIQTMVEAIQAYAERNERIVLNDFDGAASELKELAQVFTNFTLKVDEAHARDTEVSRVKTDFISTAAHQFRTPLTGIRWSLEALEKEPLTETQLALVKSAKDKSHQLVSIVGTLLDISAIESGKHKYTFVKTEVTALAQSVAQDFGELAARTQVSLYFVPPESPVGLVMADQERVKWVLNNIVENAIRYTPTGGSVKVLVEAGPDRVFIRVRDTGIGIKAEDKGNIFERFYRAENAVAKENAGNGLGLYIARTIAQDHGGDLNFEPNKEGPGTTFTLSLPVSS